ncbi:TadE/TadG family type IV pilus assembly protein [Qipengyuania spongiae]|uniref:Pilus assembly protein n=1 Tax=Qipengyuania spongiae TaxID=2909673 RepID=A0ABY5SW18_9SPHN|nr:TadE/TadG family type IV pilus assembly protein [Qipengyuania spongiae]UVI38707.1 pilus assembly protein [Qipengyuania spongiae]
MAASATRIGTKLRGIIRAQGGFAMVEFALSLPIFVALLFGGLEIINLVMAHMRVNQIAITVADNAGRTREVIDEADIYEVFAGADQVGAGIDFAENGRIVLSSLQPNGQAGSNAGQMINWQRCHGEMGVAPAYGAQGKGRTNNSLAMGMGPAGKQIRAADGTAVMFVEVTYRYVPTLLASVVKGGTILRYETAFNVRERTNQDPTNTQNLPIKSC